MPGFLKNVCYSRRFFSGTGVKWLLVLLLVPGIFLSAVSVHAAERRDFREFTIEVPEGWEMQMDELRTQHGVNVVFAAGRSDSIKILIVNFTSSMGKSMDDLVSDARHKAGARGTFFEVVSQTGTRAVFNVELRGYPARIILVLDPENQKVAILTMAGRWQEAEHVARTIVPLNPKLVFFEQP